MDDDTYKLYMIASVNKDKQCNIVKPFSWNSFTADYNPITKKPTTEEDITAAKNALIRANNENSGEIMQCCMPGLKESDIGTAMLNKYKLKFPAVREITKNGVLDYIEVSIKAQDTSKGWKPLTPYLLCKLGKSELQPTSIPEIYKAKELVPDCYTTACSGKSTLTLDHLFNSVRVDLKYTYYDDAKVAQAIKEGNVPVVEQYLRKYNDANLVLTNDDYENRIIHIASMYYKPKVLDLILAVKPNLNVKNIDGNTPLHLACLYGNLDIVERFVKLGVVMNPKNNNGETPIMLAVRVKDKSGDTRTDINGMIVRYLYNNGASLLDIDNAGNNLLHHVIKNGPDTREKNALVRFILERGVSAEHENNVGITPLELTSKLLKKYEPEPTYVLKQSDKPRQEVHQGKFKPDPTFKKNSPFPIRTYNIEVDDDNIKKTKSVFDKNMGMYLTELEQAGTEPTSLTTLTSLTAGDNLLYSDINSGVMDRMKTWLHNINPEITISQTLLGTGNKPTKPTTTSSTSATNPQGTNPTTTSLASTATNPTTTRSTVVNNPTTTRSTVVNNPTTTRSTVVNNPTTTVLQVANNPTTTVLQVANNPTTTRSTVVNNPTTTMSQLANNTATTTTKQVPAATEGFQVEEQKISKMPVEQQELLEIQTLLFNNIIRNNGEKYNSYINVADIPKGAPIDVLDHMCTGNSPEIQGIENKAECLALGGKYVKIKNPTTLVKLELLPESDRVIDKTDEDELYYNKYPAEEIERPVPKLIQTVNKEARAKPATKKSVKSSIKTNEMFTDFSETYISRDPFIEIMVNSDDLTGDKVEIYEVAHGFKNNGNNYPKPGLPKLGLAQMEHPPVMNRGETFGNVIITNPGSESKLAKTLRDNWQLVLSAVLLIIILVFIVKIWFRKQKQ